MESYFDLAMCALLGALALVEDQEGEFQFPLFWQTGDDILCSTLTIIYSCFVMIFPVYGHWKIMQNYDNLNKKDIRQKYGVFYEDNKTNTR